ncbi:outer membrane beta-barrel protein [Campylobacter curvus]|uniref:outer membrane beta-barrel protein n=1 Tax=Campylobacter curvus TaxID=200 RepID=UPI0014704274|nr:outer membrane beta-barrel protein [Campylobacter curvus]
MKISNALLKVAVLGSLACSCALAQGAFVGGSVGYNFKSGNELKDDGIKFKDSSIPLGVQGGYDFGDYRVYGEYVYGTKAKAHKTVGDVKADLKWKTHKFLVGADYTPQVAQNLRFLVGAYTGLTYLDYKLGTVGPGERVHISDNSTDWAIGGRVGGLYSFDEHNEVELGLRYDRTKFDEGKFNSYGLYAAYNYKF